MTSSGAFGLPETTRPDPRSTVVSRIEKRIATVAYSASCSRQRLHPQVWSPSELRAHRDLGVVLESYSPLGHGRLLRDPAIAEIAGRVGRSPAQVLVRWCLQHGVPTIPKSRSRERIVENAQVLDWTLGEEDMARLDALRGG